MRHEQILYIDYWRRLKFDADFGLMQILANVNFLRHYMVNFRLKIDERDRDKDGHTDSSKLKMRWGERQESEMNPKHA